MIGTPHYRTSRAILAVLACLTAFAAGCSPKSSTVTGGRPGAASGGEPLGDTLKMTVVPFEAAQKLNDNYGPLADILAKKMGLKAGKFIAVNDYPAVVTALRSGQVDLAYISALPYALASSQMKLNPIVMPYELGSATYHGIIFTRADSPIKTLADLKGKTFAFGDSLSTSGYLLPRHLLDTSGVPLESLKRWYNAGDANMVVAAVENGSADAGAAYQSVFQVAYKEHPEKAAGMRVIASTEDIPNGVYVARGDLPAATVEKLKAAFLSLNTDPEGKAALAKAVNDKVVPADDALFDHVRETARALGIQLSMLDEKK